MTTVSVVIPAFNAGAYLDLAIDSVLAQDQAPIEVIVVDDGSTDDTPARLTRHGDRITVLRQANAGVSAARNAGARHATGDLLAFLDADDVWKPQKLRHQVAALAAAPEAALVHCGYEAIDGAGRVLSTHLDGLDGNVADELLLLRRSVILATASTIVLPRARFDAISGFDERLSTAADWDLAYRLASRGSVAFVDLPLVQYRQLEGSMGRDPAAMEHDMLLAFSKAFTPEGLAPERLRRQAYGRLRLILGASYLAAHQRRRAAVNLARALALDPRLIPHALGRAAARFR